MTLKSATRLIIPVCLVLAATQLSAQGIHYEATAITNEYAGNDVSATGTPVPFTASSLPQSEPVSLPSGFDFDFYRNGYTDVWVSNSGFVTFGSSATGPFPPASLPDAAAPNNAIYACQTSLIVDTAMGDGVWTERLSSPDRFVIHWKAKHSTTNEQANFVMVLFPDDTIEVHFGPSTTLAGTHSSLPPGMGIENDDGTVGEVLPGGYRQMPTPTMACRYKLPQVDLDIVGIELEGPRIGPNEVHVTVINNGSQPFTGTIDLEYSVDGGVPVVMSESLTSLDVLAEHTAVFDGGDAWDVTTGPHTLVASISPPATGDPDNTDELSYDHQFEAGSYYLAKSTSNDFATYDIESTGTQVPLPAQSNSTPVTEFVNFPAGFEFPFYGQRYDGLWVNSAGIVNFGSSGYTITNAYSPRPSMPDVHAPNHAIYVCQTNLRISGPAVWTELLTGPDRFVILWKADHWPSQDPVEVALVLYPDGTIEKHFGPNTALPATGPYLPPGIGIENADGTAGIVAPGGFRQTPTPTTAYRYDLPETDLDVTDVTTAVEPTPPGLNDVHVIVTNTGALEFSGDIDVEYAVGSSGGISKTVTLSNLLPGESHTVVFDGSDQWDAQAGYFNIHGRIDPSATNDPDLDDELTVQIRPGSGAWTDVTPASGHWGSRFGHSSIVFDDKIWILGGAEDASTLRNDVWSFDGTDWTEETAAAPWDPRAYHRCAVLNGRIWLVGGSTSTGPVNDVWSTSDGVNWVDETATAPAPWDVRTMHELIEFNGKLWLIGGAASSVYRDDVWSFDGTTWTQELTGAPWGGRAIHQCEVLDGHLWIIGGTSGVITDSEVWSSPDGVNWTLETTQAPDVAIGNGLVGGTTTAVYNKRIWVMGGLSQSMTPVNEVWSSSDGVVWIQESVAAPWSERVGPSAVVKDDHLWLFGGYTWVGASDEVWTYVEAPSIISHPATVANAEVPYTYDVVVNTSSATLSASGLPSWLTFSGSTLSGTPQVGDMGMTGTITITATNSEGSYDQEFQIDVQGQPPQITSTPGELAIIGEEYTYTVAATGIPAPTLSAAGLPAWLSFDSNTGVLSGTPSSEGMTGTISIIATNGWGNDDVQSFRIEVPSRLAQGDGDDDDGGCTVGTRGPALPAVLIVGLLGAALATWQRRRRSHRHEGATPSY